MEKIVLVKNDKLEEVNKLLEEGWSVKFIQTCGIDIYAYIALEK
jgi:hypothetical protein